MARNLWPASDIERFHTDPPTWWFPADLSPFIAARPYIPRRGSVGLPAERLLSSKTELITNCPLGVRYPARLAHATHAARNHVASPRLLRLRSVRSATLSCRLYGYPAILRKGDSARFSMSRQGGSQSQLIRDHTGFPPRLRANQFPDN